MATEIVTDTALHQFHRTLVLNNKPSWSNTNQKTSLVLKTRDQTQYVYTIQTNPISQTNHLEHTVTQKTKHYTMDSHYYRQRQTWLLIWQTNRNTYATISNSFSPTYVIYDIPPPTLLTRKVLIVSKKKQHQKKGEWGRRAHQHEAPTPRGQSRINYHRKKEREKGQKSGNRGSRTKNFFSTFRTSEWTRTQRIFFFFFSHRIFFFYFFEHDGRQFNFGFSTYDENFIRHRSTSLG